MRVLVTIRHDKMRTIHTIEVESSNYHIDSLHREVEEHLEEMIEVSRILPDCRLEDFTITKMEVIVE